MPWERVPEARTCDQPHKAMEDLFFYGGDEMVSSLIWEKIFLSPKMWSYLSNYTLNKIVKNLELPSI